MLPCSFVPWIVINLYGPGFIFFSEVVDDVNTKVKGLHGLTETFVKQPNLRKLNHLKSYYQVECHEYV